MKTYYSFLLVLFFLVTSCTSVYIPTESMPTGFQESQDVNVSAGIGWQGVRANLAYTPLNHFYVNGAFTAVKKKSERYHLAYQYGVGTYWPIGKFSLEADIGMGKGYFDHQYGGLHYSFNEGIGSYENINGTISLIYNENKKLSHGAIFKYGITTLIYSKVNYPFEHLFVYGQEYETRQIGGFYFVKQQFPSGIYLKGQFGIYAETPSSPSERIIMNPLFFRISVGYRLKYKKQNS